MFSLVVKFDKDLVVQVFLLDIVSCIFKCTKNSDWAQKNYSFYLSYSNSDSILIVP